MGAWSASNTATRIAGRLRQRGVQVASLGMNVLLARQIVHAEVGAELLEFGPPRAGGMRGDGVVRVAFLVRPAVIREINRELVTRVVHAPAGGERGGQKAWLFVVAGHEHVHRRREAGVPAGAEAGPTPRTG